MNKIKFVQLLKENIGIMDEIEVAVEYDRHEMSIGTLPTSLIFLAIEKHASVIKHPIDDMNLGGMLYSIENNHYLVINTAHAKGMQYFYAFHDLYHIKHEHSAFTSVEADKCEVNSNGLEYNENLIERKASLYSAIMMVKTLPLKNIYKSLIEVKSFENVLLELSNHFSAPLILILLRLFECEILGFSDLAMVNQYLGITLEQIRDLFNKYGIDNTTNTPTYESNVAFHLESVKNDEMIQLLTHQEDLEESIENIATIFNELKVGGQG